MIYETLMSEQQATIRAMVSSVREHINDDIDMLMGYLEQLNEVKKELREDDKKKEAERKAKAKADAFELGRKYVATLCKGSIVKFVYGPEGYRKTAELPIEKVSAKSVIVNYTKEMLNSNSKTSARTITFDKIIVPESFKAIAA